MTDTTTMTQTRVAAIDPHTGRCIITGIRLATSDDIWTTIRQADGRIEQAPTGIVIELGEEVA